MTKASDKTSTIIVGYKTVPMANIDELIKTRTFEAPANYKDKDKIAGYKEAEKEKFKTSASQHVYTGMLDEVYISLTGLKEIGRFKRAEGQPISTKIRKWLLHFFPDAWPEDTHRVHDKPKAVFFGFEPKLFIKMLGIECSLPGNGPPLPASLWFGNTDHRDIIEALNPKDYAMLSIREVLELRKIPLTPAWKGPGDNPEEDGRIVAEAMLQLGFANLPE